MSSAGKSFRDAIARQRAGHSREVRFRDDKKSVCDFCANERPAYYYESVEIALAEDGVAYEIRNVPPDLHFQRFDKGWLACQTCMEVIEAEDLEALADRWQVLHIQITSMIDRSDLEQVRATMMNIHGLMMRTRRGPEAIWQDVPPAGKS